MRQRSAELAAMGHSALAATLRDRLAALGSELDGKPIDTRIAVLGGSVMRLGDYLRTRVVEQTVHLDDLVPSVGSGGWTLPEPAYQITVDTAIATAVRRAGHAAIVRALYRAGCTEGVLPIL